jgi:hypothetical protein
MYLYLLCHCLKLYHRILSAHITLSFLSCSASLSSSLSFSLSLSLLSVPLLFLSAVLFDRFPDFDLWDSRFAENGFS